MKTSEAEKKNNICPECNGPIAQDHKRLGYARHLHRLPNGELCTHGRGERDSRIASVVAAPHAHRGQTEEQPVRQFSVIANHSGSRRDVLLLLDSPAYVKALNTALSGTGTEISAGDVHRPIGATDDREYELPEFSREYLNGRFEYSQIAEPVWWIVKCNARVRTPNFDLISTATVCGLPGVLLVEAKAHHGELETCGKKFGESSNLENHQKIAESIAIANRALNAFSSGFILSRDVFYQVSNRIAWGWRLASLGVPVTVLYLGFVQDPYWPVDQFKSSEDWMRAAREYLGNIVPVGVLNRRFECSGGGSLLISLAALPAVPPTSVGPTTVAD